MDERIIALSSEGLTIRQIAECLGVNRGRVFRVLKAARAVPEQQVQVPEPDPVPAVLDDEDDEGDWDDWDDEDGEDQGDDEGPDVEAAAAGEPLDEATCRWLGVTVADAAGYRINGLHLHRLAGVLGTGYARRARAKARSGRAWVRWLMDEVGAAEQIGGEEPVPQSVRDARILELRRQGATQVEIAEEVGMTQGSVSQAITRIATELEKPGRKRGPSGRGTGTGRPPAQEW